MGPTRWSSRIVCDLSGVSNQVQRPKSEPHRFKRTTATPENITAIDNMADGRQPAHGGPTRMRTVDAASITLMNNTYAHHLAGVRRAVHPCPASRLTTAISWPPPSTTVIQGREAGSETRRRAVDGCLSRGGVSKILSNSHSRYVLISGPATRPGKTASGCGVPCPTLTLAARPDTPTPGASAGRHAAVRWRERSSPGTAPPRTPA